MHDVKDIKNKKKVKTAKYVKIQQIKCSKMPQKEIKCTFLYLFSLLCCLKMYYITCNILYTTSNQNIHLQGKIYCIFLYNIFHIQRSKKKAKNISPDLCFLIFLVNYTSFYRLLKSKHYIFAKPNCVSQWMEDNMCKKLMTNYS